MMNDEEDACESMIKNLLQFYSSTICVFSTNYTFDNSVPNLSNQPLNELGGHP